jgi:hypothetical protein
LSQWVVVAAEGDILIILVAVEAGLDIRIIIQ